MPSLRTQRPPQGLAERERAVLHRVMLVDVQVAAARELEREAAVLGELLEHVVEEPDAGRASGSARCARDSTATVDPASRACGARPARGAPELAHDRGPGLLLAAVAAYPQRRARQVGSELEVRFPIADHGAGGEIDAACAQ